MPAASIDGQEQKKEVAARNISITTPKGQIVLQVYPNLMPITVENFEKLVKSGFYNNLTFHRVEDWVIQGGDPKGNGTGGPGWTIPLESDLTLQNVRGAIAMARSREPNSAGSQFYVLKKDAPWLDGQYAVFGKVISGMDVVDQIVIGDKMLSVQNN
jgi:peptidyl-prolyl cis-trans isomerase B (cyclophilin B)